MSRENLVKLLEAASADEQLMQQLQSSENFQEIKKLATGQGFDLGDLSAEEAKRTIGVITGEITEELSDEELELVAGGWSWGETNDSFHAGLPMGQIRGKGLFPDADIR